jgi:hypothetical protein
MAKKTKTRPEDYLVIYHSQEDDCWIAHSLRTDQIGTGDSILSALTDALRAVEQVWNLSQEDPSVAFLREAPPEIQQMEKTAKRLPREIYALRDNRPSVICHVYYCQMKWARPKKKSTRQADSPELSAYAFRSAFDDFNSALPCDLRDVEDAERRLSNPNETTITPDELRKELGL